MRNLGLRIGSLFSGIEGLGLGLEWAGVGKVVWESEIDDYCRAVLRERYPDADLHGDVHGLGAHNLARVDVLCGGPPCQDISYAGRGAGLEGARSGLWFEMLRIIRELRPALVVVENVAALRRRGLDRILGGLASCGYDACWFPLRAADVGAPHRRERLFIVAWRPRPAVAGPVSRGGDVADTERARLARDLAAAGGDEGEGLQRQRVRNTARDRGASLADGDRDRFVGLGAGDVRPDEGVEVASGDHADGRGATGDGTGPGARPDRLPVAGLGRILDGLPDVVDDPLPWRWPSLPGQPQEGWEAPRTAVAREVPFRRERLHTLGNAVVPAVAEAVGHAVRAIVEAGLVAFDVVDGLEIL